MNHFFPATTKIQIPKTQSQQYNLMGEMVIYSNNDDEKL